MANPTPTPRSMPVGIPLGDGYQTLITFAADPDVSLWEKTVTPPGVDGGDPVDTTTMHNVEMRQQRARYLKSLTDASCTAAYDPSVYTQLFALVNVETTVTVLFPNGDTLCFHGYLRSVTPGEITEGSQPEVEVVIVCTNTDPSDGTESEPQWAAYAGT